MINNRFLITVALGISLASCNVAERLQLSKNKNTAIENRKLQGKVKMTLLNGEVVYSN